MRIGEAVVKRSFNIYGKFRAKPKIPATFRPIAMEAVSPETSSRTN